MTKDVVSPEPRAGLNLQVGQGRGGRRAMGRQGLLTHSGHLYFIVKSSLLIEHTVLALFGQL